jgi:hypothetical protein
MRPLRYRRGSDYGGHGVMAEGSKTADVGMQIDVVFPRCNDGEGIGIPYNGTKLVFFVYPFVPIVLNIFKHKDTKMITKDTMKNASLLAV